MDTSVYCLPADLLGEGADRVVRTVRDRAGVSGVTVAACYQVTPAPSASQSGCAGSAGTQWNLESSAF